MTYNIVAMGDSWFHVVPEANTSHFTRILISVLQMIALSHCISLTKFSWVGLTTTYVCSLILCPLLCESATHETTFHHSISSANVHIDHMQQNRIPLHHRLKCNNYINIFIYNNIIQYILFHYNIGWELSLIDDHKAPK